MELHEAKSRIGEIHAQLLKSEVFRGYRAAPMAATGMLALVLGALQSAGVLSGEPIAFAVQWLACAGVCAAICGADLIAGLRTAHERRRTRLALMQFAPALVAGAAVTATLLRDGTASLLPGLWAVLFALGLLSSRLHLPRAIGWVAVWYLAAGTLLLESAFGPAPVVWGMGATFGAGQLALARVLYTSLERNDGVPEEA